MEAQQIDSTEQEVQTADEPKTPTLKETLEAAVKGEDKLPEVPAEPMQEVQAEEEQPEQTEEAGEEEQVEEQAPALEALTAPKHWPKEEQDKFNVLDADTQHLVMDRFKAMEGDYTRKTQAIAKYKKRNEALDEIYGPFRDDFQRAGMDDVAATRQLLAAHKYLREDPQQAIKWLAKSYGVDLTAVNDDTATDEYADPQMKAMQQQIAQLQGTINNQQQQAQNMQKQEVQAMIDNFQTAKDADGNLKHPHFDVVQNQMSGLISSGVAKDIESAYEMAVYANPETRAKVLDEQVKKTTKQEVKAEAVQKAKKQQRVNVKGSGTPSNSAIPSGMTLNETIKFSMKQLQKG
mgnify:CR=1 FL=1